MFLLHLEIANHAVQLLRVDLEVVFAQKIGQSLRLANVDGQELVVLILETFPAQLQELAHEYLVGRLSPVLGHVSVDYYLEGGGRKDARYLDKLSSMTQC